ncbi:MAG TPA: hypothetical protein VKY37_00430 [Brumimicrobium sp.]|nr:hypothetical protein [Brumimicrobium sp.]
MTKIPLPKNQTQYVTNFNDLISTPFKGEINAICWKRELLGDFAELVNKMKFGGNMMEIDPDELLSLELSTQGQLAREILINDISMLEDFGASPLLNIIKCYQRDDISTFFPTDVYSFHADRSPVATDTFLCTYYGESSEILPNAQGLQKVLIPEIREELKKRYQGTVEGFESFLSEEFYDLHYQAKPNSNLISLGLGNLWKIAIDHPESQVAPCLHRAPKEKEGENRLMLIC